MYNYDLHEVSGDKPLWSFLKKKAISVLSGFREQAKTLGLGLLAVSLAEGSAHAQIVNNYVDEVVTSSTYSLFNDEYTVGAPGNAIDGDHDTKASLEASPGIFLGAGSRQSYLEVEFPASVDANTPVFIVLSEDGNGLLDYLVGGTLGSVINDIVDFALTGTPTLTINAKNGSSSVWTTSMNPDAIGSNRIEIGADGKAYLRVVPTSGFNRIRISWSNFAVLGIGSIFSGTQKIYVHDVFYNSGTPLECEAFLTTSYDAPGISASVLTDNPDPVRNPERAIDSEPDNYSELGYSGILSIGLLQDFSQTINFNSLSNPGEVAVIKFQTPGSLLSLTLLDNINVKVYNGSTEVYNSDLGALLDADVLGIISAIFGTSTPNYVTIPVTTQFDRVEITYSQAITGGIAPTPLRLFGVYRTPVKPVLGTTFVNACEGTDVELAVSDPQDGVTYTWYNSDLTAIGTGTTYTTVALSTGLSDTFFVTSSVCDGQHSEFVPVIVTSDNAACQPSDINGTADLSDYTSTIPVYALLVNAEGEVVATGLVDNTTGEYGFTDIPKGEYYVVLIAGDTPPAIGIEVEENSDLGLGYEVTPNSQNVMVTGNGEDINVPEFHVNWSGPDLRTSVTASTTSLTTGSSTELTYRVFNIGDGASSGLVYVVIAKPLNGSLTLGTLPAGWSVFATTDESIVLTTTNSIGAGIINAVEISATYTASDLINILNLTATIPPGFGGGERNTSNNSSNRQILINY